MTNPEWQVTWLLDSEYEGGYLLDPHYDSHRAAVAEAYGHTQWLSRMGHPDEEVNNAINQLDNFPGVAILEERNFRDDVQYRCAEWTFGTQLEEPWATSGFTVDTAPELWREPAQFLEKQGYELLPQPGVGDIVTYGDYAPTGIKFEHFGLYAGDNLVVSKFGQGPVALHNKHIVSSRWGERCWYFRKSGREMPAPEDFIDANRKAIVAAGALALR